MLLTQYDKQIKELCRDYKVKKLFAFGSVLTEKFKDDSDVDLVVEFDAIPLLEYADYYFDLKFNLEELLGRKVDL